MFNPVWERSLSLSLLSRIYLSLSLSPYRHPTFLRDICISISIFSSHSCCSRTHWYSKKEREEIFQKQIHVSWDQIKREGEEIPWHVYAWYFFHALLLLPFSSIAKSSNDSSLCNSKCIKKKRKETRYIRIISWKISISRKLITTLRKICFFSDIILFIIFQKPTHSSKTHLRMERRKELLEESVVRIISLR